MAVYDSCVMTSQNLKSGGATSKVGGRGGLPPSPTPLNLSCCLALYVIETIVTPETDHISVITTFFLHMA